METGIYSSNVCRIPFEELEFKLADYYNNRNIVVSDDYYKSIAEYSQDDYLWNLGPPLQYKLMGFNPTGLTYNSEDKVYEEAYQFGNEIITPEQMMIVIKSPYSYYGNRIGLIQEKSDGFVKRFTGNEFLMDLIRR